MSFKTNNELIKEVAEQLGKDENLIKFVVLDFWKNVRYVLERPYLFFTKGINLIHFGKFYFKDMYRQTAEIVMDRIDKEYQSENHKQKIVELLCKNVEKNSTSHQTSDLESKE